MSQRGRGRLDSALYVEIGRRVKVAREAAGRTRHDVATQCGLHQSMVTYVEDGRGSALHTLYRIARALEMRAQDLFPEVTP